MIVKEVYKLWILYGKLIDFYLDLNDAPWAKMLRRLEHCITCSKDCYRENLNYLKGKQADSPW